MNYHNMKTDELINELHKMKEKINELEQKLGAGDEDALTISEARYKAIVENQTELICRFRPDCILTFVNEAYCSYFNKKSEELVGTSFLELIPEEDREKAKQMIASLTKENPVVIYEHRVILPSGEIAWQQWSDRVIFDNNGRVVELQSVGRDITRLKQTEEELIKAQEQLEISVNDRTLELIESNENLIKEIFERKRAEELLKQRLEMEHILSSISSRFVGVLDLNEAINLSLKDIGELNQVSRTYIFLLRDNGTIMDNTHEWCNQGVSAQIDNLKNLPTDMFPWWMDKLYRGEIINIDDVSQMPLEAEKEKQILQEQDVKSLCVFPLKIKEKLIGFFGIENVVKSEKWSETNLTILRILSELLSKAFEGKLYEDELRGSFDKLQKGLEDTINGISKIVETRDPYTAGHQRRVAMLSCAIAEHLELSKNRIKQIKIAASLHDIGKIYVPAEILSKPGKLNDCEFNMIKMHAEIGYEILKGIDFLQLAAEIIRQHHEKLDGSGYPQGLSGDKILLGARIVAVADVVEAIASHRPYRSALGAEKALEEIKKGSGKIYDPQVVEACTHLFYEKGFIFEED